MIAIQSLVQNKQNEDVPQESGNDPVDGPRSPLQLLLGKLYVHIYEFGRYLGNAATPDEKIIAAWQSFLGPINALTAVEPHGYLIAARMSLYLAEAYRKHGQLPKTLPLSTSSAEPIALRCNFAISLDDLLLSCLIRIWTQNREREIFKWVFTDYPVNSCRFNSADHTNCRCEQRKRDQLNTACITDPAALAFRNGVQPRYSWKRAEGDTADYSEHPNAVRAGWAWSPDVKLMLMWQDVGSDGPIRESFRYILVDRYSGEKVYRDRAVLRRSRQFILDARKIAECHLARDSERLAQAAMARRSLPAELQLMVFQYLDEIQEHPYLGKLDLSAVYRPFPDISRKCKGCTRRASSTADRMAKATCPSKSITVWSLPLRVFHTFHQTSGGDWQLCTQIDCAGHHRDETWQLQNVSIEDYLDSIVQVRCGQGLTIGHIGLGPLETAQIPAPAGAWVEQRHIFKNDRVDDENRDVRDEALWSGVSGLANVMMHNKTDLHVYTNWGRNTNWVGRTTRVTTDPSWLLGRTRQEESRACAALARDHAYCQFC